ncbi:MAG: serine hydrolase [Pseudohongiellaceae bacterium]
MIAIRYCAACVTAGFLLLAGYESSAQARKLPDTVAAYSAGYKAAFTCSATFNSNKSVEQINSQELQGIYPAYQSVVENLPPATIDYENRRVSVAFSDSLPPRIAVWRPHLGCTQLPTGADAGSIPLLPSVEVEKPAPDDDAPWSSTVPINGSGGNAELDRVVAAAFRGESFNGDYGADAFTTAILVATTESILAERYLEGFDHRTSQRTWSVAKSITATVIGAAVQQGLFDVSAPTAIPQWQNALDPRKHITVENLLHMTSGLDSDFSGSRTDPLYLGGSRVIDTAVGMSVEVAPGTRWKYANNDTLLAMHSLRVAMVEDAGFFRFPFESVLYRIGMLDTYMETDWNGDFVSSSQVWTTSRDLARLGVLYLNDGLWNGERILPEGWVSYVSTPGPAQPAVGPTGYGAQFWLYNERSPNIPDDAFAAHGNRGQYLMIIPSENLVIVRRGHDPAGGDGFELGKFTEAVLQAMGR